MIFSKILINWYLSNRRKLPWRETSEPYKIWLSEIMLQQTRVEQGMPYYFRFIEAFPTVKDLALASPDKVLKLWQGLGYYSRARNLHETAKYIAFDLDGKFPNNYTDLLKLKGVGDYTASAIASICFNEPVAVVDGNVYRVLARYFNIKTPINATAGIKEFKELATELLDVKEPSMFNQGLMEFGALQCKPQNPLCDTCPFNSSCLALKNDTIKDLPVKLKKGKIKKRYFNYLVFQDKAGAFVLKQRQGKGIWNSLYEFPLIETNEVVDFEALKDNEQYFEVLGEESLDAILYNEEPVIHKLSHQHIYTRFWIVQNESLPNIGLMVKNIKDYPVPVLIQNFLNESNLGGV